jgi:hypothetical protein
MPRGVPKAGFRKTRKSKASVQNVRVVRQVVSNETDAQIRAKLDERFSALELMTECAVNGDAKAVVISGPAGLGKSFGVTKVLDERQPFHTVVRGYVRATGLYKTLYEYRAPGSVVVFDDADSIFADDVSLNLLKAACDTTKRRVLSWLTESKMEDEEGERLPRSFEFEGTVIFITNYDFDQLIERGSRLAPHFQALISRSMYLDMAMKTNRDYMIRIKQVVEQGMLEEHKLGKSNENAIVAFIEKNQDRMRELSLRMVVKIAALVKSHPTKWESLARIVCCK